ncbi:MAG: YfhO family protein [Deltaproteobacteria bacterium]|nr:YfhO family protein [Deltaproteobacteria bacterium]
MRRAFGALRLPQPAATGFLLLATLLLLWPAFLGRTPVPADILYENYFPWKAIQSGVQAQNPAMEDAIRVYVPLTEYAFDRWRAGTPPLWNPLIVAGTPEAAASFSGAFYPLNALYLLPHRPLAHALDVGLHLFLAMAFMQLFLRALGCSGFGATLGGIVYGLGGLMAIWLPYAPGRHVVVWLPLAWYFLERLFHGARLGAVAGLGVAVALQILGGHAEYLLFQALLTGFYLILRGFWWLRGRPGGAAAGRLVGRVLLSAGVALMLGAIQWLPLLEVRAQSHRITRALDAEVDAVSPFALTTLISPRLFGSPMERNRVGPTSITVMYIGIAPLLLAVAGAWWGRGWRGRGMAALFVLSFLVATKTPLTWFFYDVVPLFSQLRTLRRIILIFAAPLSVLAGVGASALQARLQQEAFCRAVMRRLSWARIGALGALLGAGLTGAYLLQGLFYEPALRLVEKTRPGVLVGDVPAKFRTFFAYELQQLALAGALLIGFLLLVRLRATGSLRERPFTLALLLLTLMDLLLFARGIMSMVDLRWHPTSPPLPAIAHIKADTDLFRVMPFDRYGPIHADIPFPGNTLIPYGVQALNGIHAFLPRRTLELMGVAGFWGVQSPDPTRFLGRSWVSLMGLGDPRGRALFQVRYLITSPRDDHPLPADAQLIYRGEVNLYRLPTPLPRAFVARQARTFSDDTLLLRAVMDPGIDLRTTVLLEAGPTAGEYRDPLAEPPPGRAGAEKAGMGTAGGEISGAGRAGEAAEVTRYEPERVEVRARSSTGGWLVLLDAHYPGWRARVDALEVPVLRANYAFRAVRIPPGESTVLFFYAPAGVRAGLLLSGLGVLLLAALLVVHLRGREAGPAQRDVSPAR